MLSGANNSGHAEGSTKAGVSEGTLIVRDKDKQQQDVAQLNRDTEHANDGSISPIFNKEKEQNRLKQAQLIGEIGGQAMDVIRTQGDIAGLKAQKDPVALAQAREQLEKSGKPTTDAAVMQRAYDNAMRQYGTGSDLQKAAQAVTGALTALAGNNQSAAAGGLGAGGGELAARYIAGQLFPGKTAEQLSESEKQQVSALSQLAAGLAGGLATGDTAGAVTGGQAGKNAVENNLLGGNEETQTKFVQEHGKNIASCSTDPSSDSCQKGLAMNDALMVALPAGLGGGLLAAATPEIAAAAKAAIQACAGSVVLCLNNVGIQVSEAIVPGGVGAGSAVGIGKTAAEATAAKAEAVAANAAKSLSSGSGPKINAGKFGQLELDVLSQTGAKTDPAVKAGNFTVAGRALQKHGSREGSAFPVAKGTPAQMNEQGQKILDGIVKTPGATVKEGNRFGGFDVIAPDGRGARFDPQGNFRGFLEP
jgi:filamentous hemagglutinin